MRRGVNPLHVATAVLRYWDGRRFTLDSGVLYRWFARN